MTTAHRPTWKAAVGRANEGGYASISTLRSVRDEAGHTKLKLRSGPQLVEKERHVQESLAKLEEAERKAKATLKRVIKSPPINPLLEAESEKKLMLHDKSKDVDDKALRLKYDDTDIDEFEDREKRKDSDAHQGTGGWSDIDSKESDSDLDDSDLDNDSDDEDDDESDEDDEAALQAELAKIKQEREAVKQRQLAEQQLEEERQAEEAALTGNPLLNATDASATKNSTTGKLKRKWNDDVVFRNQARSLSSNDNKKRFINDTVRNDFHRRFLNKFIR